MTRSARSLVYRFGLAVVVSSAFLVTRIALGHRIDSAPYVLLIAGVLVCTLFAGAMAGVLSTLIMVVAQFYFFSPPYLSLSVDKLSGVEASGNITFAVVAGVLIFLLWGRRAAKGLAAETEEQFLAAFDQAAVGMSYTDMNGRWLLVNRKYCELMGYTVEELRGKTFEDLTHPDDIAKSLDIRQRLVNNEGTHFNIQKRYIKKDGTEFWADMTLSIVRDEMGNPKYFVAVVQDITDRLKAEERIEYEHKRIHNLFAEAPALIATLRGPEHKFEFANKAYRRAVGENREIIGKPIRDALPELEGQGFYELLDGVYSTGKPFVGKEMKAKLNRGDGEMQTRYFDFVYQCSSNEKSEIDGIFIHAIDVTDQVEARIALEESRQRLELAQNAGNIGTFEWNIRTNKVIWSPNSEALYDMKPGSFGGTFSDWIELIHPEDREVTKNSVEQAIRERKELNIEYRILDSEGRIRWIAARARSYYGAGDVPERMVGINRNVSQRKRAERHLRFLTKASTVLASSLNYETTLKNVSKLAVGELADRCTVDMLDDNGEIVRLAQSFSKRIKHSDAQKLQDTNLPYPNPKANVGVPQVLRSGQSAFYRQLSDEEMVELSQSPERLKVIKEIGFNSVIIVPIQILGWAAGAISLSLVGPNEHYDESDLALAESLAERASAAIDNAWLYKETQTAREELEQRVELRTQELLNKNAELNEAQSISHLGSWEWDILTDERRWSDELYRIYGLDPDEFIPTTDSIRPYTHPDDSDRVREESRAALTNKEGAFVTEFRIIRPDGVLRNLYGQGRVLKDDEGKPVKMVGTVLDITDRKKVEQMKTDFVSLVSHQLKTPLAIIKGYTDNILLGIAGELTDKQRQYLREMQAITTKYYYLIADLLNVSRIERGVISIDARPVDLIEIARAASANYLDRIKAKRLKLVFICPDRPIIVRADHTKTIEAIGNVIDNAIKFTDSGRIKIELVIEEDKGKVTVSDTGKGMSQETVAKLFRKDQVFSGSPSPEGGSGLGLYITKEFMKYQSGDVRVTSELGRGSKFTFYLPLAKVSTGATLRGR